MWTHSDVAVLLKAVQTANLLQDEEFSEPQPGIEAMLDRCIAVGLARITQSRVTLLHVIQGIAGVSTRELRSFYKALEQRSLRTLGRAAKGPNVDRAAAPPHRRDGAREGPRAARGGPHARVYLRERRRLIAQLIDQVNASGGSAWTCPG